ncbi:histidine phosphatase superfamily, partial [Xylogone sp. PMI_703]
LPNGGMRLLLVRHGETVHNVAGVYAGVTDSSLTNHGVLQAERLGKYFSTELKISRIFSSDLQRAIKTAEAILFAQDQSSSATLPELTKLAILREQDYGSMEGKGFRSRSANSSTGGRISLVGQSENVPIFKDVESIESMRKRMSLFLDQHLIPCIVSAEGDHSVVVVAHGIILSHMWTEITRRVKPGNISFSPSGLSHDRVATLENIGVWSNTGYLDLEIKPAQQMATLSPSLLQPMAKTMASSQDTLTNSESISRTMLLDLKLVIKAVNSLEHLKGLKKTRGGIGSSAYDSKQKTMDTFFSKKRKRE